jgi:hypothetical protein
MSNLGETLVNNTRDISLRFYVFGNPNGSDAQQARI